MEFGGGFLVDLVSPFDEDQPWKNFNSNHTIQAVGIREFFFSWIVTFLYDGSFVDHREG